MSSTDDIRAHAQVLGTLLAPPSDITNNARGDGRVDLDLRNVGDVLPSLPQPAKEHGSQSINDAGDAEPTPPNMNIVIQVVGSRGDIQPFVALGLALRHAGHRVRIATHREFRDLIKGFGLEFFNIGGDPKRLMAYMVRNPGLLPSMESLRDGSLQQKREDIKEILEGCWHSCYMPDDGDGSGKRAEPFLANAIIANPPSFAHVHCAEKLGIPLHLMFTMPWSPTRSFPHPLANVQVSSLGVRVANYLSYGILEELIWEGLGRTINAFRRKVLGLPRLDRSSGPDLAARMHIPYTYCWSPALIPKPEDWGARISISGFYFLPQMPEYKPPRDLQAFLEQGPPPIYVGFGSIIVEDARSLTVLLLEAIRLAGVRAVISTGWSHIGIVDQELPPEIFTISDCPHDWVFRQVSCVVHHCGAGTTAAAIAAGAPSVVVPFFGDQPFWGQMIAAAGAGPKPIPIRKLTAANLATAIQFALTPEVLKASRSLANIVNDEDGVTAGVQSFHHQLDISIMRCTLTPMKTATWQVRKTDVRLGSTSAALLMDSGFIDREKLELLRPCAYNLHLGPRNPVSGIASAMIDSASEAMKGLEEVHSSFATRHRKRRIRLAEDGHRVPSALICLKGISHTTSSIMRAPIHAGVAFTQGLHNVPRLWGDQTVRPLVAIRDFDTGMEAMINEVHYSIRDSVFGLMVQPFSKDDHSRARRVLSGLGTGILSGTCKIASGLSAIITYPLAGLDSQAARYFSEGYMSFVEAYLVEQGRLEAARLTEADRDDIIQKWSTVAARIPKRRLKRIVSAKHKPSA